MSPNHLASLSLLFIFSNIAHAQDAGTLLRDAERQNPPTLPTPTLPLAAEKPAPIEGGATVRIEQFQFEGNTQLSATELQKALTPWRARDLSFGELQQAANAVTESYRRKGFLARAYLPEQNLNSGTVNIIVIEARMGKISIEDGGKTLRTSPERARNTLTACQKQGDIFNLDCLQRGINLVNDLPGAAATVVLSPSATTGETDVITKLMDKPMLSGSVQLDNNGSRSTGDNKISGNLNFDNPTRRGDQIQIASAFTSDTNYMRFAYSLPVGYSGMRIGAHTSFLQYWLGKEFTSLAAAGEATVVGLDARYPLLRGATDNLAIVGTLDNRGYLNNANAAVTSDKSVNVLSVGLTGDRMDAFAGGGFSFAGLFINTGKLNLSGNATDLANDKTAAQKDGNFNKIAWNAGRLQKLTEKTNLWLAANGQIADKNLDSSESFSLGGPAGVRAYPNMEGTGDEGWLITAEVRRTLTPKLTLTGFYDHGHVAQHKTPWTNWNSGNLTQPESFDLKGAGISISWNEAGNYTARLIFARRIGDNPLPSATTGNDGDGSKVLNRIWLNYVKFF